ncbi:MAG: PDZ domain-containing protein [Planctomycetota bacterium]
MGRKQVTIRAAALAAAAGLLAPWGAAVSQPALVELELEPIEIVGLIEVEPEAPPLEELVVAELGLAPVQAVAPEFESVEVVTLEPTVAQPVRSRSVMVSSDDGTTYRIEIEDGDMLAMIDGQPIAPERVEVLEDGFVILGKNGEKLKAFTLPTPPDAPKIVTRLGQRSGPAVVSVAPNLNVDVSVDRDWASPKVMVGLAWEEPSEALRYHLNIDGDKKALLVTRVVDGLPADKAGLRKYDVIIAVDGDRLGSYGLGEALEGKKPGDDLELTVRRGSRTVDLEIELAEYSRSKLGLAATSAVSVPAAPAEPKALWTTRTPAAPAAPTPPEWADATE